MSDNQNSTETHNLDLPVKLETLEQLLQRPITIPEYIGNKRKLSLLSRVMVIGAGNIAKSVLCKALEEASEQNGLSYGVRIVSTRNGDVVKNLKEQDHLFVAVEASQEQGLTAHLNGVITDSLFVDKNGSREESLDTLFKWFTDPDTRYVFLTITEAGYCLRKDLHLTDDDFDRRPVKEWLDWTNEELSHDVMHPDVPQSVIGMLVEGIRKRRKEKLEPFVVIPCENMPRSGLVARQACIALAREQGDFDFADWLFENVHFSDAMVDRITPKGRVEKTQKWLSNEASIGALTPVTTEPGWRLCLSHFGHQPVGWRQAGIEFMTRHEIESNRLVKGSLLNGAHYIVGFVGRLLGYNFVHEAIEDEQILNLIGSFMEEIEPTLIRPPGYSLESFREKTIQRFRNSYLPDELKRVGRERTNKTAMYLLPALEKLSSPGTKKLTLMRILALWTFSLCKESVGVYKCEKHREINDWDTPVDPDCSCFPHLKLTEQTQSMCRTMYAAAAENRGELFIDAIRSHDLFPAIVRDDDDFLQELCDTLGKLHQLVQRLGVKKGASEFLRNNNQANN